MSGSVITDDIRHRLQQAVTDNTPRQIDWLKRLASYPSTKGNETPCQLWLVEEFRGRGWKVDCFALDDVEIDGLPGASPPYDPAAVPPLQVVAEVDDGAIGGAGRSLILQGHVDVVPPGPLDLWPHPPFEPTVEDGWMSGRGVNDMKVGVASMVFALDAIRAAGFVPDGRVLVETVTDEECTGNGALATLARGYTADACLIPESHGERLLRAQTGAVWFRVRITGKAAHVLEGGRGVDAIALARACARRLAELAEEANRRAPELAWFRDVPSPVSFSVGRIEGGDWTGMIPSWAEMHCRLGVLPGDSLAEVRARIEQAVGESVADLSSSARVEITWAGFQAEAFVLEPGTEAEAVLAKAHETVHSRRLEDVVVPATSDARLYGLYYSIPTLSYGPLGQGSHGSSERTDLSSMTKTTLCLALFIAEWCGLRPLDIGATTRP